MQNGAERKELFWEKMGETLISTAAGAFSRSLQLSAPLSAMLQKAPLLSATLVAVFQCVRTNFAAVTLLSYGSNFE
jgi:hypothetical protein